MSKIDFDMEILNIMFKENENGYFDIKTFKRNQVLEKCFYPPSSLDILEKNEDYIIEKEPEEIRLVISDLAFSGNNSKEKNDYTVFMCMSLHWNKFRFERHVDYIEKRPGGNADKVVLRIKELYHDYQADYLVIDQRSGGEVVYDYLSNKTEHPERSIFWDDSGFTVVDDKNLHIVSSGKIEELQSRTVDKDAIPCIIPFIGTKENNSLAWQSLKKQLSINNIKLLISMDMAQSKLEDSGEYFEMTSEQFAEAVAPYGQTESMIQECVKLEKELTDGLVKLKEPRSGTKDIAVVFAYGNYIAEKIENQYLKYYQEEDENIDDIQLVF